LILLHTAIAIILVVLLIMVFRIGPVIALVLGSIYLGLAAGLGGADTAKAVAQGFGAIMAEVGLLIAFGVLLGSLLAAMGTLQRLVEVLLRVFGPRRLPYASSIALTAGFPVIYGDVLLVLMAPLVRSLAPRVGRDGMAAMSTALAIGINVGLVFVVPGAAAIAIAGLLEVPLGTMLIFGLLVSLPTAALTMFIYGRLLRLGLWDAGKDEMEPEEEQDRDASAEEREAEEFPPLYVSLLPIVVALLLVASGVVAGIAGLESGVITFLGFPEIALFLALLGAYLLAWRTISKERADDAIGRGFRESGIILIITGVGGSLATVVSETGLEGILAGYFSAGALAPLLLAWLIAAILEMALGSATVAIITSGGILAPVVGGLDVSTVLIALAASSGALFGIHLNSNFFWIWQPLLGLSTQGTIKTLTLPMAVASLVSLLLILALNLVL
jgi:H+/gluconate symporter-like permease